MVVQDVPDQFHYWQPPSDSESSVGGDMAYRLISDEPGHGSVHVPMQNVMEPELVMPTSDDDTPGSPSTPGSNRRYMASGSENVKRAMSSPNVRSLVDGGAMSAADKKRNKLGYHRTAVACGHCRRRKIRCIPALDDTSGRCSNCIRLKKECQFFPVDQQNASSGRRGRSSSKAETSAGEGDISASSSEPGVPHILRSSTEDSMSHMSDQSRTPVSPDEHFNYQRLNYPSSHGHETYDHRLGPSALKTSQLPNTSTGYPHNSFFATDGAHRLHGPNSSVYGTQMFNAPSTAINQQGFYQQHHPHIGEYDWQNMDSERSVSIGQADESYTAFAPQRAQSYPTVPARRVSAPRDMSPNFSGAHGFPVGQDYQQHLLSQQYPESAQYTNIGWAAPSNARIPLSSGATAAGVSQPWFATPLSYVREEEDGHPTQAHTRLPFHPG